MFFNWKVNKSLIVRRMLKPRLDLLRGNLKLNLRLEALKINSLIR